MDEAAFERVIDAGKELQAFLPSLGMVAVGGVAVALHCRHRFSTDVDCVTPLLSERFSEVVEALESWEGWKTNRRVAPVVILGERHRVELGIRQLRRTVPLQTAVARGLRVPTPREALRIKAFLCVERRGTRDFLDVAALIRTLGEDESLRALRYLDLVHTSATSQTVTTRFAEACESDPVDLHLLDLGEYKGVRPPSTTACRGVWTRGSSRPGASMDPDRSTVRESPLSLLNIVQRGGTEEWKALYRRCRDRAVAEQVARVLPLADPDLIASARVWKRLLEGLHPGLRVELGDGES
jgi:hypothetical protein